MTSRSEIENRIARIITEHLNCDPTKVLPAADLGDDLGAESLDFVEIIMALEEEFQIAITDEAAETVTTVGDFTPVVEACLGR